VREVRAQVRCTSARVRGKKKNDGQEWKEARQRSRGRRPQHQRSSGWSSGQRDGDIPRPGQLEGGPTGQRAHSYAGEAGNDGMRVDTSSPQGTTDRSEGDFLAPAMLGDATSMTAGGSRTRTRSDDEESAAPLMSRISLVSTVTKGKKRRLVSLTPDVSEELAMEVRMSSAVHVSAEVTWQVAEIMRVAKTSSKLKGTYVKALKDATGYITTAWQNQALQSVGLGQNSGTSATRLADARMTALEKENAALRQSYREGLPARTNAQGAEARLPSLTALRARARARTRASLTWRGGSRRSDPPY
jgi:hypothetical protein